MSASVLEQAVAAGDITRTVFATHELPLHTGSGRLGGNFDAYGLQNRGELGGPGADGDEARVKTVLTHKDHWHRDGDRDRLLPLATVAFQQRPEVPLTYRQHLSLFTGTLTTELAGRNGAYALAVQTDPHFPDLLGLHIQVRGSVPGILLSPCLFRPDKTPGHLENVNLSGNLWHGILCVLGARSFLACKIISHRGRGGLTGDGQGARVSWSGDGEHFILIAGGPDSRREEILADLKQAEGDFLSRARQSWRGRWLGGGYVSIPNKGVQSLWARSVYYQFCGNDGSDRLPAPPCGLSGLAWQFCFPQDVSFIHPALLRLGHQPIVEGWVRHWHFHLSEQKKWTTEIFRRAHDGARAAGVCWAMSTPIGHGGPTPVPGRSNPLGFQIHNGYYPARMAWDLARHRSDPRWTQEVAWPLIEASAQFYGSMMAKGGDGLWGLHVLPSAGQDEFDGFDQGDYLCSLYCARGAFSIALAAAKTLGIKNDDTRFWGTLLKDGLAFPRLTSPLGVLAASPRYADGTGFGRQKHPCQFQPLVFSPNPGFETAEARKAFQHRDELCERSSEVPRFGWGWTLPAMMAAATRLGEGEALAGHTSGPELRRQCGDGLVSFRESTHPHYGAWYFTTNHGLFMQAVQDVFVDDSFGDTALGRGLPKAWKGATYGGLRTAGGEIHHGP